MHDPGPANRWVSSAMAAAVTLLVARPASAWVITGEETLRASARAGAAIVYPPPSADRVTPR